MRNKTTLRLTESALMLAFATVLSLIAIVQLPYGGSITACSMLPILLIAYRHGTVWGVFTGLAYGVMQLLLGMNNLTYGTSIGAVAAILLLDYLIAFACLGLGGVFRKVFPQQSSALVAGTVLASIARYICHVISGCTVWAGVSIPDKDGLIFSLAYNATYMLPEMLVTIVGALYLSKVLDFRAETITRAQPQQPKADLAILLGGLGKVLLAAAAVYDIVAVFSAIQIGSGFDITLLAQVDWMRFGIVTVVGIVLGAALLFAASRVPADHPLKLKGLFTALPFAAVIAAAGFDVWFIVNLFRTETEPFTAETWATVLLPALCVVAAAVLVVLRYRHKKKTA